ncbi:ATP-dependent helicase, partial [Candidatus Woesearchaeota archaeon]|nr:ATP-dependent helicase [Candidatus Woesearchaeota archaeon]
AIINELIGLSEKGILEDRIYCVYTSPLKALTKDIEVNLKKPLEEINELAGKDLGIRIGVRTGDTSQTERSSMLRKPPHILITTPESLALVLSSSKFVEHLKNVEWLILDEIHSLAENKRGVHLSLSVERLAELTQHMCRVGLSATISPLEEIAKFLVGYKNGKENDCNIVDVRFQKQLDLQVISPLKDFIHTTHQETSDKLYLLIDKLIQEHKTTLIFTNTRSATERVVDHLKNKFPKNYTENIGAHHGSLSRESRYDIEERLRAGKLKVIVSSTSLELGIDIGYIDLVICLGSPKSVARALQRLGRSGHALHDTIKGRIIVLDRDDLVECSLILKSALERKIDKIHIPTNCLDVLAQQIDGIAVSQQIHIDDLFRLIKRSYCYKDLDKKTFMEIIEYLAGRYVSLEERHVYAKIWHDEETGLIGRKGRLGRVIYMTNVGTIPDETFVQVKIGNQPIGSIDESFLEKLRTGDVFVLGGNTYEFKFSRGMVAQVKASSGRPPTVPSWFSEMLPLSFDLSLEIGKFRRLMEEKFKSGKTKNEILAFINKYLYVDENAANAIYEYFEEQFNYAEIPSDKKIIIENYEENKKKYIVFHTLYGRRVNDCLSRAFAYAVSRKKHFDVEIGINDNGFYVALPKNKIVQPAEILALIKSKEIDKVLALAIDQTEVMKRRFRHCATRALMILRSYKGHIKRVGRQQVSSMILMSALKRISNDFCILKEARREVLEDLMDIADTRLVLEGIEKGDIKVKEIFTTIPTPFAFNIILQGYTDILKMEDKIEFLKNMHQKVLAKIALKQQKA